LKATPKLGNPIALGCLIILKVYYQIFLKHQYKFLEFSRPSPTLHPAL